MVVQSSKNRCFPDTQYERAGAEVKDELDECQVIAGIKPVKIDQLRPGRTYVMYSRLSSGSEALRPYLKALLDKKICLIDYERIRDETGRILVGSSKLAGFVGLFNAFRVLGEHLLLRKNINTSFLHIGGSAYMHKDKHSCISMLQTAFNTLFSDGGFSYEMSPFVIGIVGRGVVSDGAIELLKSCVSSLHFINPSELSDLYRQEVTPGMRKSVYVTILSREHYIRRKDGEAFDASAYELKPDEYECNFA